MAITYPYSRPAVTVDPVVFTMLAGGLAVLLVRRKGEPFKGSWALPGGFIRKNETLHAAVLRELQEETGVKVSKMEQVGAFGDPGRDPRGHTVTVAFVSFVVAATHPVRAGDDAAEVAWVPLRSLRAGVRAGFQLAFDHGSIIAKARERLVDHLHDGRRKPPFELVPPRFTLTELQRVYEAVLGGVLDKRNFRARILDANLIEPVAALRREGAHRPAQLYRWRAAAKKRAA